MFGPEVPKVLVLLSRAITNLPEKKSLLAARQLCQALGAAAALQLAHANGVRSALEHVLPDIPGHGCGLEARFQAHHEQNHHRITAFMAELDQIASLLATAGVSVILIENAVLVRAVGTCPGCFDFGDLDLLVRPQQLPVVHRILTDTGYELQSRSSSPISAPSRLANGRAEYKIILPDNVPLRLNLQSSLVARRWFSPDREPDLNTLFARSKPIPGGAARMLCPEDYLFQLALHNASHGYVRRPGLRLHLDIEQFVRRVPVNWDEFLELVEQFQVKTMSYLALVIPRRFFGTPIPDEVLERLQPPTWKEKLLSHGLQQAGLFGSGANKFGRAGYILFTILLNDDLVGLWHMMFPDQLWLRKRYGVRHRLLVPCYHLWRLVELIFCRAI